MCRASRGIFKPSNFLLMKESDHDQVFAVAGHSQFDTDSQSANMQMTPYFTCF